MSVQAVLLFGKDWTFDTVSSTGEHARTVSHANAFMIRAFSVRRFDYRTQLLCLEARRWASAAGSAFFSGSFARLELASRSLFYLLQSFSSDGSPQASCVDVGAGNGKRNETICWLEAETAKVHHHPASPRLTLPRSPATLPETQYSQSTKQSSKVKPSSRALRPSKEKLFTVSPGGKLMANQAPGVAEVLAEGDEPGAA